MTSLRLAIWSSRLATIAVELIACCLGWSLCPKVSCFMFSSILSPVYINIWFCRDEWTLLDSCYCILLLLLRSFDRASYKVISSFSASALSNFLVTAMLSCYVYVSFDEAVFKPNSAVLLDSSYLCSLLRVFSPLLSFFFDELLTVC